MWKVPALLGAGFVTYKVIPQLMMPSKSSDPEIKTVVVLGASYGGYQAVQSLRLQLPETGWRILVVDRNTHFNHLYAFPRFSVVAHHDHKAFIPLTKIFDSPTNPHRESDSLHRVIHASVTRLEAHRVYVDYLLGGKDVFDFEYCIYALGSELPKPINLWNPQNHFKGDKINGCRLLQGERETIEKADRILILGGGALGVQYATDIASVLPNKSVTLAQSRATLLPRFDVWMHEQAMKKMEEFGVKVLLNTRIDLEKEQANYDLVLTCTGQIPNSSLVGSFAPESLHPRYRSLAVLRTLQLAVASASSEIEPTVTRYPHIFVIGDVADAFDALNAGHTAWAQGDLAGKNIGRLIKDADPKLDHYLPPPYGIKVTLGLDAAIAQERNACHHVPPENCAVDLHTSVFWDLFGVPTTDMTV